MAITIPLAPGVGVGRLLTHQMKRITPKLQQSTAFPYPVPASPADVTISGARYVGVPQRVFIKDISPTNRDRPKSVTLMSVSLDSVARRMFSGCGCEGHWVKVRQAKGPTMTPTVGKT